MMDRGQPKLLFPGLAGFYAATHDLAYLMVRVVLGISFLVPGWGKFNAGTAAIGGSMARMGLQPSAFFAYSAIFLETVGAICLIIGLFTRFFAAALAVEMLIAMFAVHLAKGFSVAGGGYAYVLLLGTVCFAIALRGGGRYSVDHMVVGKEL